jgi:YceI-like domain
LSGTHLLREAEGVLRVFVVALLAACAPQVAAPPELEKSASVDFPSALYRRLVAEGKPVFRVNPARSLAVIEVRRGGSFAGLGHDHVVASHDVAGNIAPDEGRADIYVPLATLVVDEPVLRAEAGFDTQPDADDIAGTRRNMLQRVLDTDRYPYALIGVKDVSAGGNGEHVQVAMTLHGVTHSVDAMAHWERTLEEFSVTGTFAIDQTQFGIAPLSILGGAISVQDRVNVSFRIRAHRPEDAAR